MAEISPQDLDTSLPATDANGNACHGADNETTIRFHIIADQLADDECGFDFCEMDRAAAIKFTDQLAASVGRIYKVVEYYIDQEAHAIATEWVARLNTRSEVSKSRIIHTSYPSQMT